MATLAPADLPRAGGDRIQRGRHSVVTRVCHWINLLCIVVLIMSGLQIFNAYPSLHWGEFGATADPAWLRLDPFPGWATIPTWRDLATGRQWHFFFGWVFVINGLVYLTAHTISGHMRRDIIPRAAELAPAHVWHDVKEHARLNFPKGEAARRYHVLQKLAYGGTLLVILPVLILSGLSMSPSINASWDFLPDLFGGRAGARSMHFIAMWLLIAFIVVHVAMVMLAGPLNQIRSMITGRFDLGEEPRA